jgi:hypothetical protein
MYFTVSILGTLIVAHVQEFPSTKSKSRSDVLLNKIDRLKSSSWNFLAKFLFLKSPPVSVLAHSVSWMPASRETEYQPMFNTLKQMKYSFTVL